MIHEPHLMPDFRDGLEQALYRRASQSAPAPAWRLPRVVPRPRVAGRLALGTAVLVAALVVVITTLPGHRESATAQAEPQILSQPTQPVPANITAGRIAKSVLGDDAEFERSIPLTVSGQTFYLLKAQTGWCILPVSGGASSATGGEGFRCATTATLENIGLAAFGGDVYVAAVPPKAVPPTLVTTNGSASTLTVSPLGIASAAGVQVGDQVTLHGRDGTTEIDPIR